MTITEAQARTILDVTTAADSESLARVDAYVLAIDLMETFPALRDDFKDLRHEAAKYVGLEAKLAGQLFKQPTLTPEQLAAMLGKSDKWVEIFKQGMVKQ